VNAPIRVRLTGWYVLVLAGVVAALTAFVVTRLRSDLTSGLDRSLRQGAVQIAQGYQIEGAPEFRDKALTVLPGPLRHGSGAQILDPSGAVALSEGDPVIEVPLADRSRLRSLRPGHEVTFDVRVGTPSEHLRAVALPVTRHGQPQVLVAVESLAAIDRAVHRVFVLLLLGSAGALALVALGGWWIARKALMPVEQMTRRAEQIGIAEMRDQRIAVPRVRDELSHLAGTLNAMLDRLQQGVEARERLIADASHELRAPLSAMRSELEVSLRHDELSDEARAVLASARDEVVRMGSIIDNLLTLARVDEGRLELLVRPQDLREVVARAMRGYRHAAETAGVELVVEGEAGRVDGDGERLQQVVDNLVDNAIRHAPAGSTVLVSLWRTDTEAGVTVCDEGPGVPEDERDRIFERFARRDRARPRAAGAGLGLAISKEIVSAHGGRIWVEDRAAGTGGSAFVVALPLRSPEYEPRTEGPQQRAASFLTAPSARSPGRRA
jgi:two-component system, OmpR family, sensor kinase